MYSRDNICSKRWLNNIAFVLFDCVLTVNEIKTSDHQVP